ncbi:leucine-rich repeat protein [Perkinsela sp. CCAP 1560/4]|nr:leucine-rich repeat protein [Perkinsela sp. CCAP 1560/4]|eukprot:KNH06271.1 leucine-rich repeat protein [Perkinsela sp. CCAP 1560/4]
MIHVYGLQFSDPNMFGRIDVDSLNEQTLMEILCGEIRGIDRFQDDTSSFLDIATWKGVGLCSSDGTVERINWGVDAINWYGDEFAIGPFGTINLDYLPRQLIEVDVTELLLEGKVHTWKLPRTLVRLCLGENKLNGTFETAGLPTTIEWVNIMHNDFVGSLDISSLPKGVQFLGASRNGFTGSVDLEHLPPSLVTLWIDKNKFQGTIRLSNVPETVEEILLQQNAFQQETLIIGEIPEKLIRLDLVGCKIGRVVDGNGNTVTDDRIFL